MERLLRLWNTAMSEEARRIYGSFENWERTQR